MYAVQPPCPDHLTPSGAWEYHLQLPHDPRAPGVARTTVRAVLVAHGLRELVDTAALLTSELATNAYRYAQGPASLRVDWEPHRLRVAVRDSNPELPAALAPDPDADGGRGLFLLDLFADRCGGYALREEPFGLSGKMMWFELAAR
ncbi:ATP-binding protein [Streptomyces sp. NPDC006733]|uniref:ATP-binding protein n=1 Tax=Streptomyces sp. NPDC006733 TaxID=3155460 RepID=UPI0033DFFE5F